MADSAVEVRLVGAASVSPVSWGVCALKVLSKTVSFVYYPRLRRIQGLRDSMDRGSTVRERESSHVAVVAMANKIVRIAWAVMTTGKAFDAERGALAKPEAVTA